MRYLTKCLLARPGFVFDFLLLPIATVVFWLLTPEDNSEEAAAVGRLLGGGWHGMLDFDGSSVADGDTVDPGTRHSDTPC